MGDRGCTSLDHVYPVTAAGMPCYCGARTWAGAPRAVGVLKVGEAVLVNGSGERRVVTEKLRGEPVYRVDVPVGGRALFDREELTRA